MTDYPQYLSVDNQSLDEAGALALPEQVDFLLRIDAVHTLSCFKKEDGATWAVRLSGDGNLNHYLGLIDRDGSKFRTRLKGFPPEESFYGAARHLL